MTTGSASCGRIVVHRLLIGAALLALGVAAAAQTIVTRGTNLSADVATADGTLAIDLLGRIWTLGPGGGVATLVAEPVMPARRPRWSPDGRLILYQAATAGSSELWLVDVATSEQRRLHTSDAFDQHANWHPDGARVVYSSARRGSGLDIWETDLQSGLQWRLTDRPGDETEPAWSANGRHLVYIHRQGEQWALMLRRFAQPDIALVLADEPLAAPSWRPDGTLITYLRQFDHAYQLQMIILSDPPLERRLATGEDFALAPVSWQDRERLFYTSDGRIRTRGFDEWSGRTVAFRATVGEPAPRPQLEIANRELPLITPAESRLVIRSRRLFDGFGSRYRESADVLIENGLIAEISDRRDWPDETVLDLGDITLMPGLIDVYATLPDDTVAQSGAQLLSWGITSIASPEPWPDPASDADLWESEDTPGPRLLRVIDLSADAEATDGAVLATIGWSERSDAAAEDAARRLVAEWQDGGTPVLATSWMAGLRLGAGVLLAADAQPASPLGNRYQDIRIAAGLGPVTLISGIADAALPGLDALLRSRQAEAFDVDPATALARRLPQTPDLRGNGARVVAGSRPNGLPPGLALHAELQAMQAAGLRGDQALRAAGIDAARLLGLAGRIGEISPGARADLLLVSGDPLEDVSATLNIVAVIRNGRFMSLVNLLERAQ